jgi:hypothetical protein
VSQPRIAAFARLANGNVGAARVIEGQATKMGRTLHGIAYNPLQDEIIVTNPYAAAVLVFRGGAQGDAAPIRVIQGPNTKLVFPHSVSIDVHNKEILVADTRRHAVLVYPLEANGDTRPVRVLEGPTTKLFYIVGLAVDPVRNLLVVASKSSSQSGLFIFNRTDNGDVEPRSAISGPKTGLFYPWQMEVYGGKIFVAELKAFWIPPYGFEGDKPRQDLAKDIKIPSPWGTETERQGFIGVWNIEDSGDVGPRAIIKGAASQLIHPAGLALNVKEGEIFTTDSVRNGIFTFLVPQFFAEGATRPTSRNQR